MTTVLIAIAAAALSFMAGFYIRKRYAERLIRTAESKAREILVTAKREAEDNVKRADREAKGILPKMQKDFEDRITQTKRDLDSRTNLLEHKEETIDQKLEIVTGKEKDALYKLQEAIIKENQVEEKQKHLDRLLSEERAVLQKLSGLDPDQAKQQYLKRLEIDVRSDAGKLVKQIEDEAKELADKKAKKILSLAMQRVAASHTIESTVTPATLPNEEMKGRIIGKEGRNIRSFETLTGVDLVIDD